MTRGLKSVRSQAAEEEASSYHEATSPRQMQQAPSVPLAPVQPAPQVSPAPVIQHVLVTAQRKTDIVAQLLPILMSIQQGHQLLVENQTEPVGPSSCCSSSSTFC